MNNATPVVSVIIPFFQRKPGILAPCVTSVLQQKGCFKLSIVITDDGSPVSAEDEIKKIDSSLIAGASIQVIVQQNHGPGAARNTCLENLPKDCTYIALMDSDDAWKPDFLNTAVMALEQGYDLFFSNSQRYGHQETRFDWNPNPELNLDPRNHILIDESRMIYEYKGDFFDFLVRRSNILGPSTTIYRRSVAPGIRFRKQFFNGQDRVFKLELGPYIKKVAFSTNVHGIEGEGINIFDSAGWGSPKSISLLSSYIEMTKYILRNVQLSDDQRTFVRQQLDRNRLSFAANLLHRLARRESIDMNVVRRTFRADPMTVMMLGPNILRAAVNKFNSRSSEAGKTGNQP